MANRQIIAAIIVLHQQQASASLSNSVMNYLSCTDHILLLNKRRNPEDIGRVADYYEATIPRYSPDDFKTHFRLSRETFQSTCDRLSSLDEYNKVKGPTPDHEKELLMFLWYIGNLESYRSMADRFGTSKGSFHASVKRVSSCLTSVMPEVIKWPATQADFDDTSRDFSQKCQFQNVVGAIDGSHIPITAPKHHPHAYFNRKKFYSIVLLASCNSRMEFNYVWTGNPGSTHDATVLRTSDLFENSDTKIPAGSYILGDSAFPIMGWLITPFRDCGNLTQQQKLFNKVHSQCRQVIERTFGMLKCRFRRLLRFESSDMNLLVDSVLSACVLHNLCILERDAFDFADLEETETCHDDVLARDGHQLQGIRLRQQLMTQLL